MPVWSSAYDPELKQVVDKYQRGAPGFSCTSPQFESLTVSESPDNTLSLLYTNMLVDMTTSPSRVVITCSGWRNPLVPTLTPGYYVRTFSSSHSLIDQTEQFSVDATGLLAPVFGQSNFEYALTSDFLDKPSNYTLTFTTDLDVTSGDGCFVKYTFPQEVDLSGLHPEFAGAGMLVAADGDVGAFVAKGDNLRVTEELVKWIAIEGCQFDPRNAERAQLANFV